MAVMIVRIAIHGFLSVCCSTVGHQSSAKGGNEISTEIRADSLSGFLPLLALINLLFTHNTRFDPIHKVPTSTL